MKTHRNAYKHSLSIHSPTQALRGVGVERRRAPARGTDEQRSRQRHFRRRTDRTAVRLRYGGHCGCHTRTHGNLHTYAGGTRLDGRERAVGHAERCAACRLSRRPLRGAQLPAGHRRDVPARGAGQFRRAHVGLVHRRTRARRLGDRRLHGARSDVSCGNRAGAAARGAGRGVPAQHRLWHSGCLPEQLPHRHGRTRRAGLALEIPGSGRAGGAARGAAVHDSE